MLTSINASIQAISKLGESIMNFLTKSKEQQSETAIIKDRNKLKEASDITEEMLWIAQEYIASDSQFTMWIANKTYDLLNKEEKRLFKAFYKTKMKLRKRLFKKKQEFEKVN